MKYILTAAGILLMVMNSLVAAEGEISGGLGAQQTPSVETAITRTIELQTRAEQWALDSSEYQRFLELIRGPLGKWSPDIDPLLALGMFAESSEQQRRYAELYAQQEFDFTERTLKFQQAYRDAFERLYPDASIVDQHLLAPYFTYQQQKSEAKHVKKLAQRRFVDGDHLLVFVPRSCHQCLSIISQLMGLLSETKNSSVGIYVRDAQNDGDVREWARTHRIKESWLDNQALKLNRDEGLYQQLASRSPVSSSAAISLFLRRNEHFFQLNAGDLGI